MLADMLASAMNSHCGGGDHSATYVELQVIRWISEALKYASGCSGILTSGATMANILGLAVALHDKAGFDINSEGLQGSAKRLKVYASTETHVWLRKAARLLGLGEKSICSVPVDDHYRIDIDRLQDAIYKDVRDCCTPIAIVGNIGTVNTGAIDDVARLKQVSIDHDLWLHLDGAFGALARMSVKYSKLVPGIELADSIAMDLHKWMCLPIGVGCLLVRDAEAHRSTFASSADYLAEEDRGLLAGGLHFANRGIELTRPFRALKVWMAFKVHGRSELAKAIESNIDDAKLLETMIKQSKMLEMVTPRTLNITCFGFREDVVKNRDINAFNKEVALRIQEGGRFLVSLTYLKGRRAIRVAITNHRSQPGDFRALIEAIEASGSELLNTASSEAIKSKKTILS